MDGVQFFLELIDFDDGRQNVDELIDRFTVNLTLKAGSLKNEPNLAGIFNIAEVSLEFEARCRPGFRGDFCLAPSSELGAIIGGSVSAGVVVLVLMVAIATLSFIVVSRRRKRMQSSGKGDDTYDALVRTLCNN